MVPELFVVPGSQPARPPNTPGAFPAPLHRLLAALILAGVFAGAATPAGAAPFFKRKGPEVSQRQAAPPPQLTPAPAPAAVAPAITTEAAPQKKKKWFQFRSRNPEDTSKATDAAAESPSPRSRWGFAKREVRIPPAPAPVDMASIVRIQIYLDGQNLGPGKIDGTLGEFTKKAAYYYNQTHGIEPGNWGPLLYHSRRSVPQVHAVYVIKEEDRRFVGSLPYDPPAQAKKKYMSYRSLREFVEERFHTDENYLARANPGRNLNNLSVGDVLNVPNVAPFRIEDVQKNQKFERAEFLSARHVVVDTKEKFAFIQNNGATIAAFPITPGQEKFIPYGDWKIDTMVTTPTFRYDKQMLQEGVRGDDYHMLPPGPNSPVGMIWAGLTKSGIGLHGTNNPNTIGRARSAGCIRLANWDAVRLSQLVRPGATVEVR